MVAISDSAAAAATAAGGSNNNNNITRTNEYEEVLDRRLRPLQPVLWGLNHRNRNQHRRAAWWGAFGMLRRRVDKLVDELAGVAASKSHQSQTRSSSAAAAAAAKKGKKRKRAVEEEEEKEKVREEEKVRDHVRWLRDVLVPKCYLAFSQLTADNQFATLGVVLLGALAQVHAACAQLVGDAVAGHDGFSPSTHGLTTTTTTITTPTEGLGNSGDAKSPAAAAIRSDGLGQGGGGGGGAVVSRDEVARAEKLRREKKQKKLEGSGKPRLESSEVTDSAKGGQKNYGGDDDDNAASKVKVDGSKSTSGKGDSKPSKKKKKTKEGGDEFDDLFKGLF